MITYREPRPYPVPDHEDLFSCYNWHPDMPDNVILRVSKSSVGDFTFCKQQYAINRVLGMKEPQNDNMLRGTNVHDSVELFYQRVDVGKASEEHDLERYFRDCIPHSSEIRSAQDNFFLGEDLHIDRFLEKEIQRFNASDPQHFLPTGNELVINHVHEIEVDGVSQRVHFTGIIDRIFTNPDGSLHIHELKTGAWKDSASKFTNMRKEMAFYVWLLRKSDPTNTITHWGWDHTKGVKNTDTFDAEMFRYVEAVRAKEIGEMLGDIQNLIRTHRKYKGDDDISMFPLLPSGAQYMICDPWCGLKEFCPRYHQHLGDE
jgi:hypothetical protein